MAPYITRWRALGLYHHLVQNRCASNVSCVGMGKEGSMIAVEAKKVGMRVIATVKVRNGTRQYTYTVQFADQGSAAANEAGARRELAKLLKKF